MALFRALIMALICLPLLAASAFAQSSYRVRTNDIIRVEVLEDSTLNRDIIVLPDGRIPLPFVGSVMARGRTLSQIQADITAGLTPSFAKPPTVFVGISLLAELPDGPPEPKMIDVFIMGEVSTPGKREIESGTTLLQFLAEMGGFTRFAATKRIQLRTARTGQEQIYTLNYRDIEAGAGIGSMTIMAEGDVIVVPQRRLFE